MTRSPRYTRRAMLALVGPVAALGLVQVGRAQTIDSACALGFVDGLLQYSPDCPLVSPPALGAEVAPPSHLVSLAQTLDGATGTTSEDTPPQSGSRRKRAKQREHQRRKFHRQRRHRRLERHREARGRRHRRRKTGDGGRSAS